MTRLTQRTRTLGPIGICLGWTLSQTVAWGIRPLLTALLNQQDLPRFLRIEETNFGLGSETSSFGASGFLLGVALWLLLRGVVPHAWLFLPLTLAGWLAVAETPLIGLFLGGALVGGLQWVALRRVAPRAWWPGRVWLAVSTGGWLLGLIIGQPLGQSGVAGDAGLAPDVWAPAMARGMALGGFIYGVLLGTLLAVLLSQHAEE